MPSAVRGRDTDHLTATIPTRNCSRRYENASSLNLPKRGSCSGLVHLLASHIMAEMLLNCWFDPGLVNFVKFIKFMELAGGNMLAATNVAICVNLALIVHVSVSGKTWCSRS